ncbi:MAG: hypothetical protein HW387_375 [Parachlamydiales bacterium]|nr:hypothetical protein [Parachlamydiales bacterium]
MPQPISSHTPPPTEPTQPIPSQQPTFPVFIDLQIQTINLSPKQVTICASEAQPDRSDSVLNDEDHSQRLGRGGRMDMATPQQAGCHPFEARVNILCTGRFAIQAARENGHPDIEDLLSPTNTDSCAVITRTCGVALAVFGLYFSIFGL